RARPRRSLGDRKAGPAGSERWPRPLAYDRRRRDVARGMAERRHRGEGKRPPRLRPAYTPVEERPLTALIAPRRSPVRVRLAPSSKLLETVPLLAGAPRRFLDLEPGREVMQARSFRRDRHELMSPAA